MCFARPRPIFRGECFNKPRPAMDRLHIYQTRTLIGVEFAQAPAQLPRLSPVQHTFVRLNLAEIDDIIGPLLKSNKDQQLSAEIRELMQIAGARLAYWETKIPVGSKCFVHHIRFDSDAKARAAITEIRAKFPHFALLGLYQINPSASFFPEAFPVEPAPSMWEPGAQNELTTESQFFFNFFPDQPYLLERVSQGTIAIWAESAPGLYDTNNYVDLPEELSVTPHIDRFVGVNLNRYRNAYGFCRAVAGGASKSVIAEKHHDDFHWYGMLTKLIKAA
ncbi:MAG: hypothetical protein JO134_01750 [Xanthobacteraceae bacterium]|nr:hypothetical protein [Xanthobacteraceae bacterium]